MELFEEALQKWEQALSVGQRGDSGSTPTPGDSLRNPEIASEALAEVGGPHPGHGEVGGQPDFGRQPGSPAPCQQSLTSLDGSFFWTRMSANQGKYFDNVLSTCLTLSSCSLC